MRGRNADCLFSPDVHKEGVSCVSLAGKIGDIDGGPKLWRGGSVAAVDNTNGT